MRTSAIVLVALLTGASFGCDNPQIVSVSSDGEQGNGDSLSGAITPDGRFVGFSSFADNLVPEDTNGLVDPRAGVDIFVHDRETGMTERVSIASDRSEANGPSESTSISANGRFVAFASDASNLIPNDTNETSDAFVHDRDSGATTRVSIRSDGGEANGFSRPRGISADGRLVLFISLATNLAGIDDNSAFDTFLHDRLTGSTTRLSVNADGIGADDLTSGTSMSPDGRYVVMSSAATNLVPNDANGEGDVILLDRLTGNLELVSVASDGSQANGTSSLGVVSPDGRFVTLCSMASNLVPNDTNGVRDVFVRDRLTSTTTRVSVATDGTQGNFDSGGGGISDNGRFVVFSSVATNLVPGDTNGDPFSPVVGRDIFLHDRLTGETKRVSVGQLGEQGNSSSTGGRITPDGRFVLFNSSASNLALPDTNFSIDDVFVRQLMIP